MLVASTSVGASGSAVKLRTSKCFGLHPSGHPICAQTTCYSRPQLLANAAMAASRLVAVRRGAVLMIAKRQRPHPRHANWHSRRLHDPANDDAIAEHVEIVVTPFAGGARSRRMLED